MSSIRCTPLMARSPAAWPPPTSEPAPWLSSFSVSAAQRLAGAAQVAGSRRLAAGSVVCVSCARRRARVAQRGLERVAAALRRAAASRAARAARPVPSSPSSVSVVPATPSNASSVPVDCAQRALQLGQRPRAAAARPCRPAARSSGRCWRGCLVIEAWFSSDSSRVSRSVSVASALEQQRRVGEDLAEPAAPRSGSPARLRGRAR